MLQADYTAIVEWLYLNDGAYPTKNEWREAFLEVLCDLFSEEQLRKSYNKKKDANK